MSRSVALALGAVFVVIGIVWTTQGLGYLGGSPMTGVTLWAVIGPIVALAGVALMVRGGRGGPGTEDR